jgi:hypothetical protein
MTGSAQRKHHDRAGCVVVVADELGADEPAESNPSPSR